MKITPLDIHHKKFKTGFKGYNVDEVDQFLDELASQLDVLYKENSSMKEKTNESEALVNKYKDLEGALNSALVNAQKLAEEVVAKATAEAETIVGKAKREAKEIFETSVEQRNELMQSIKRLQKLDEDSKTRLLNVLDEFTSVIQGSEAAVDQEIMRKEEHLSEQLDDFMNKAAETDSAEPSEPAEEVKIEEPAAITIEPQAVVQEIPEPVIEKVEDNIASQEETPSDVSEISVTNNVVEPAAVTQEEIPVVSTVPEVERVIEINADNLVSSEEKSLLLTAGSHTQELGPEDNPFADLGEGVPGAIRRKKKINE